MWCSTENTMMLRCSAIELFCMVVNLSYYIFQMTKSGIPEFQQCNIVLC